MTTLADIDRIVNLLILMGVITLIAQIVTLTDILRSDFQKSEEKTIWFLFVLLVAPMGMLFYLFMGRFQKKIVTGDDIVSSTGKYRDIGRR